jgi:hypothetical protein
MPLAAAVEFQPPGTFEPVTGYRVGGPHRLRSHTPQGMPLESLWCTETRVKNLSPLKSLPLTNFHCTDTPVSDLLPLEDCKRLTHLQCAGTKVTPAQIAALHKALPNWKIEWDDPAKAKRPEPADSGTK